jgi:hypothetical protein
MKRIFTLCVTVMICCTPATACDRQFFGRFGGPGGCAVIAASLPRADSDRVQAATKNAVRQATADGALAKSFVATAMASSAEAIAFGKAANFGNFWPGGRNESAWKKSILATTAAATADVGAAFARLAPTTSAEVSDPLGTLSLAMREADGCDRKGPRVVSLATSGLIATDVLHMFESPVFAADPIAARRLGVESAPTLSSPMVVNLVGIGTFQAEIGNVTQRFAESVTAFWSGVCDAIRRGGSSCRMSAFPAEGEV